MTTVPCVQEADERMPLSKDVCTLEFWQQFNDEFPTEKHCVEALLMKTHMEQVYSCTNCGSRLKKRDLGSRMIRCSDCKRHTWLLAGTFFHHIKLARPWLAAIWLMEHGVAISACRFHKLLGIAYSTAWNIFKKLTTVIQTEMKEAAVSVPSSEFSILICRRSRETPAGSHPLEEQIRAEKAWGVGHLDCSQSTEAGLFPKSHPAKMGSVAQPDQLQEETGATPPNIDRAGERYSSTLSPHEQQIYNLLDETKMHFDQLCQRTGLCAGEVSTSLTLLELAGLITRLAGDRYARTSVGTSDLKVGRNGASRYSAKSGSAAGETVSSVIGFVRACYQGVSQKYLQHFLAVHWCHTDRARWRLGSLFRACIRFGPISEDKITEYVTPAIVNLVVCH